MKNYYLHKTSGNIYTFNDSCPLSNCEKMPQKAGKAAYITQCRTALVPYFTPKIDKYGNNQNAKIYCNITRVSSSGMSRTMEFYAIQDDELQRITPLIAGAGGYVETDNGLRVSGCGMDMRFAVLDSVTVANNLDIRSI